MSEHDDSTIPAPKASTAAVSSDNSVGAATSTASDSADSNDDFACLNKDLADIHDRLKHIRDTHSQQLSGADITTLNRADIEESMLANDIRLLSRQLGH